ncbi:ABC transporter substrate-binding protein [Rhodospira trueperi]|uniref:Substrate-binding protein n=1 Tax=Rhodospira trueperi TaxID=69960 RepID=A0A1G7HTN9_9PROT|nr:ABC transporter substrate-binding protein [Rhodospira trueperi]SDF03698.1 substrate-binding protein [Rhodospira trueperi]
MTALFSMRTRVFSAVMALALVPMAATGALAAKMGPGMAPPERQPVVMVGDRLVNVAYHLGVIPQAMSIRGDIWDFGRTLARTSSMILGCPNYIVAKDPDMVPRTLRESDIRRVLIEHTPGFDRHKPVRDPMNLVPLLEASDAVEDLGVSVEVVDFSEGVAPAIRQIGTLIDRTEDAEALVATYEADLEAARAALPSAAPGTTVVILNGVHQDATGKGFVRVELPGGYADTFLLEPMGLTNAGRGFVEAGAAAKHGFAMTGSLAPLADIHPDILVLTGDADAVQRKLRQAGARDPAFADIPAIADGAVFALPAYYDSNVIEYPAVLRRWAVTLKTALGDD